MFHIQKNNQRNHGENFQIENHEDNVEEQELENVDLEMVTCEEKSNKKDEKEVLNTEQNNDTLVAVELNLQTFEELEVNDKENVILEGFSSKANSFEIDSLNMV